MLKLWPSSPSANASSPSIAEQLTPRAGPNGQERANPFDAPALSPTAPASSPNLPLSPSRSVFQQHHLLSTRPADLTPTAGISPPVLSHATSYFAAAIPSSLSLHAPHFNIMLPPSPKRQLSPASSHSSSSSTPPTSSHPSSHTSSQSSNAPPPGQSAVSRGQIHLKLLQARGLNVRSVKSRPYVVVEFEQNEFISRDPIAESEKEAHGVATTLSRTSSSTALNALGAIQNNRAYDIAKRAKSSANSTPRSSVSSGPSHANGLASGSTLYAFGGMSAYNPVWRHGVAFDVTSDQSVITFYVYDRASEEQAFLGMVEIKPVLIHDHTVDQWYKLRPCENEVVSGEMRVQITYEQFKTRRALTPRDFEFLKLIGRGTFGRVFQVRKKDTKRIYAMKVLSKKEIVAKKEIAHTIGERKILQKSLDSPFLVGLKFSFQTDSDLYLVTDFKSGGELFWHLQHETRFSEERARFYVAELILALEHLHKYDIVYRDLKPENILLDANGHVALCDFGLSKPDLKADQLTNTFCGTTEYLAPEVLLDDHGYSKLVDFWSLGVLLFEMCCGWSPFYAEDTQKMYNNICFGKIKFPRNVIGEDGKLFVKGLLNRNPKHRLGAQRDAEQLKEHPFFKTIDWRALALKQITPPFKPIVESDESVANFDPEFTSADLRDVGIDVFDDLDEEDPSPDWLSQSMSSSLMLQHTPNGPLGSDTRDQVRSPVLSPLPPTTSLNGVANGNGNGTDASTAPTPIKIGKKKRSADSKGSPPLTSSVQANFRGFSFTSESLVAPLAAGVLASEVDEEAILSPSPEDRDGAEYVEAGFRSRANGR